MEERKEKEEERKARGRRCMRNDEFCHRPCFSHRSSPVRPVSGVLPSSGQVSGLADFFIYHTSNSFIARFISRRNRQVTAHTHNGCYQKFNYGAR